MLGVHRGYSFTKRFTALCHVFLRRLALPVAAVIAIEPTYLGEPTIWLIAGFVLLWVAGFDIIYALRDLDFDRAEGLHSVPAALGWKRDLGEPRLPPRRVRLAHARGLPSRGSGRSSSSRPLARGRAAGRRALGPRSAGQGGLDMAFFTLNGIASVTLGLAGTVDLFL